MKPYLANALRGFGSGFHFSVPPPSDIHTARYLHSPDPDEALGSILANFQRGNFSVADVLLRLLQSDDSMSLWNAGCTLLGYGAPMEHVRAFVRWALEQDDDDSTTFYASKVGAAAGGLWVVEPTLERLRSMDDANERVLVCSSLSWLLESDSGTIERGPILVEPWNPSRDDSRLLSTSESHPGDTAYCRYTLDHMKRLCDQKNLCSDAIVAEGDSLSMPGIARRLLSRLAGREATAGRIGHGLRCFRAMTGLDCRDVYTKEGTLQRLTAAAFIEDWLESSEAERFAPGGRYFFGHRIPD